MSDGEYDYSKDERVRAAAERTANVLGRMRDIESLAAGAQRIQDEVAQARASVWSPGREVRITVGATGLLEDVEYSERAADLGADSLAAVTTTTIRRALLELQERIDALAESADDPRMAASVAAQYRAAFAPAIAQLPAESELRRD